MTPDMAKYTFEHGSYYLRDERTGGILLMTDQVAFAFDSTTNTQLKHGDPKQVLAWWKENKDKAPSLFDDVQVMTLPRGTPVDVINRALSTSGYIAMLRKMVEEGTLELLPVQGPRQGFTR